MKGEVRRRWPASPSLHLFREMVNHMAMTAVFLNIDETRVAAALCETGEKLDGTEGESILDFSSVSRIDSGAVRALEELGRVADEKNVKVVLRGVNVDVYKVLKLMKLTRRFSFVN
jgi:anti-anti-sigma regulatory factor